MVKARITKLGDESSSYVTGNYSDTERLLRDHQLPWHWEGSTVRVDLFYDKVDPRLPSEPFDTVYLKA